MRYWLLLLFVFVLLVVAFITRWSLSTLLGGPGPHQFLTDVALSIVSVLFSGFVMLLAVRTLSWAIEDSFSRYPNFTEQSQASDILPVLQSKCVTRSPAHGLLTIEHLSEDPETRSNIEWLVTREAKRRAASAIHS
jgi:hypothetical protein